MQHETPIRCVFSDTDIRTAPSEYWSIHIEKYVDGVVHARPLSKTTEPMNPASKSSIQFKSTIESLNAIKPKNNVDTSKLKDLSSVMDTLNMNNSNPEILEIVETSATSGSTSVNSQPPVDSTVGSSSIFDNSNSTITGGNDSREELQSELKYLGVFKDLHEKRNLNLDQEYVVQGGFPKMSYFGAKNGLFRPFLGQKT